MSGRSDWIPSEESDESAALECLDEGKWGLRRPKRHRLSLTNNNVAGCNLRISEVRPAFIPNRRRSRNTPRLPFFFLVISLFAHFLPRLISSHLQAFRPVVQSDSELRLLPSYVFSRWHNVSLARLYVAPRPFITSYGAPPTQPPSPSPSV